MTQKLLAIRSVLRLKERAKEDREAAVKRVMEQILREEQHLVSLEEMFRNAAATYELKHRDPALKAREIELYTRYFSQLTEQIGVKKKAILERMTELQKTQFQLLETHREKKVIESLKDKIVRDEKREHDRAEQKEMDHLFLTRRRADK